MWWSKTSSPQPLATGEFQPAAAAVYKQGLTASAATVNVTAHASPLTAPVCTHRTRRIGGAIFVAGVYSLIFGTPNRLVNEWCAARWAKISARRAPTLGTAAPAGGGSRRVVLSARGVGVAV